MIGDPSLAILIGVVIVYLGFIFSSRYITHKAFAEERQKMKADGWQEERTLREHYWHKVGQPDITFGQYTLDKEKRRTTSD